jgi:hypothetical protein
VREKLKEMDAAAKTTAFSPRVTKNRVVEINVPCVQTTTTKTKTLQSDKKYVIVGGMK